MGVANFPFPSFTFVLTSDRVIIPGPSYVIRFAPLVVLHPPTPQVTGLMMTNTTNGDMEEERLENDSISTVALGHSDPEELLCDIPQVILKTPSVQIMGRGNEVENKNASFPFQKYIQAFINDRLLESLTRKPPLPH